MDEKLQSSIPQTCRTDVEAPTMLTKVVKHGPSEETSFHTDLTAKALTPNNLVSHNDDYPKERAGMYKLFKMPIPSVLDNSDDTDTDDETGSSVQVQLFKYNNNVSVLPNFLDNSDDTDTDDERTSSTLFITDDKVSIMPNFLDDSDEEMTTSNKTVNTDLFATPDTRESDDETPFTNTIYEQTLKNDINAFPFPSILAGHSRTEEPLVLLFDDSDEEMTTSNKTVDVDLFATPDTRESDDETPSTIYEQTLKKDNKDFPFPSIWAGHSLTEEPLVITAESILLCHINSMKDMLVCELCNKSFSTKGQFMKHKKSPTTCKKTYECESCGQCFIYSYLFKIHCRKHTGEKPFTCEICNKSFAQKQHLKKHEICHADERPYPCVYCDKSFKLPASLKMHIKIHTGEGPYKCDFCGEPFPTRSAFSIHRRIHTGEKPYVCTTCGKKFSRAGDLNNHKRIHTGERPHACTVCGKTFITRSHLKEHERIHTGEKSYECNICRKSFAQNRSLKNHAMVHSTERPYQCNVCNKSFKGRSVLIAHARHTNCRLSRNCEAKTGVNSANGL